MKKLKRKEMLELTDNVSDTEETALSLSVRKENCDMEGNDIMEFAELFGESVAEIKNGIRIFEIRRFANVLGQLTVRYEIQEKEIFSLIKNSETLGIGEILTTPVYLKGYRQVVNKSGISNQKVCAVIDFPLGEGTLKSKVADIKACEKFGVDGYTVVMPALFVKAPSEFKKQIKKIKKLTIKPTGVALSTQDLADGDYKTIFKSVEKIGVDFVTFIFGDQTESEILDTARLIKQYKGKTEVRILGNVCSAQAVAKVRSLGADKVFTPYAVKIVSELLDKFKVKNLKLV